VLGENLTEVLHGGKELRRIEPLIANHQHRVLDERLVEPLAHCRLERTGQIYANCFRTGV
jgi:hypothetical protein